MNKTDTKHTPTPTPAPWTIVNAPANAGFHARIYARGCVVCDVHTQPSGIDAQNAAHIVRCVNAHDELVAALRECAAVAEKVVVVRIDQLNPEHYYDEMDSVAAKTKRALDKARAALAKAGS